MDSIIELVSQPPDLTTKRDDSVTDRISNRYTVLLLMVFAVLVTVQIYVGSAIACWAPVHFTDNHIAYTNSYCWVRNTYYLPYDEQIPRSPAADPDYQRQYVTYYQWVPFILLAQAVLFYLPSIVWHGCNQRAGIDADLILETAQKLTQEGEVDARQKKLRLTVNQIYRFCSGGSRSEPQEEKTGLAKCFDCITCRAIFERFGSYLVCLNLFVKFLYVLNALLQFVILNGALGMAYNAYGISAMGEPVSDTNWNQREAVVFPRVTMCDFNMRRLGNVHRYTVQCTLPINLYNEKIFLFLWFWIAFVCIAAILDFITWLARVCMRKDRLTYLTGHLAVAGKVQLTEHADRNLAASFLDDYLRQDGVFLLRLIGHNTNKIIVNDIIRELWDDWRNRPPSRPSTPGKNLEEDPLQELYPPLDDVDSKEI